VGGTRWSIWPAATQQLIRTLTLLRENNAEKGGGTRFFLSAALKAAPRGRAAANVLHFK